VVVNEHTLGTIQTWNPYYCGILHTSPLRGSYLNRHNPILLSPLDTVRLATRQDFEDYRCAFGNLDEQEATWFDDRVNPEKYRYLVFDTQQKNWIEKP